MLHYSFQLYSFDIVSVKIGQKLESGVAQFATDTVTYNMLQITLWYFQSVAFNADHCPR